MRTLSQNLSALQGSASSILEAFSSSQMVKSFLHLLPKISLFIDTLWYLHLLLVYPNPSCLLHLVTLTAHPFFTLLDILRLSRTIKRVSRITRILNKAPNISIRLQNLIGTS